MPARADLKGKEMTERRPLTDEEKARANDLALPDTELTERELQFRNYLRRLTDWTPDKITIIRDGKPISGPGLQREIELGRMAAAPTEEVEDDETVAP